jgi:RNA polymerase sigma-70 factor (ECF subfamily)
MVARLSVFLFAGLLCTSLLAADAKSDKLEGTWKVVGGEEGGKAFPTKDVKGEVIITKDTITVQSKEDKRVMRYKVDPSRKPGTIEMTTLEGKDKGETAQGIYQLEGDTLKMAFAPKGQERPTEFSTKAGSKQMMFVMKRQSK